MRVFYLYMAALLAAGFPADALTRTYFLPDYQSEFYSGNRVQDSDSGHHTSTPSCSDYGLFSAPQNNTDCQRVSPPAPGLVCYSCTTCSADYAYDSSNCSGDYVTSGSTCSGKYSKCVCDRSKFPVSSGGCPSGQKIDTANSCKGPSDTETYYQCVDDPCAGLTDNTTDLGCQSYYRQCPSLCEIGKTCVPNDCSEYTLTSCPANAVCEKCSSSCGSDNTVSYRISHCIGNYFLNNNTDPEDECRTFNGEISFTVRASAGGRLKLNIDFRDYILDWGDGTRGRYNIRYPEHIYDAEGDYTVSVTGNVHGFGIQSHSKVYPYLLNRLDLESVSSYRNAFADETELTGSIPELPPFVTSIENMFKGCSQLSGSFPDLPESISVGSGAFRYCENLSGSLPKLPPRLSYAEFMFQQTGVTGEISNLPASLEKASYMFQGCKNITSVDIASSNIVDASGMFADTNLQGDVPVLPDTIKDASAMFEDCHNLNGVISNLPANLEDATFMFQGCEKLQGSIPSLPSGLTSGREMFEGCTNLSGNIPDLPDTLENGMGMFSGCSGLSGSIPALPESLKYGGDGIVVDGMFERCSGLTGEIPELPHNLKKATRMFYLCSGLSGETPPKPDGLTDFVNIFTGTNVTLTSDWPDKAK